MDVNYYSIINQILEISIILVNSELPTTESSNYEQFRLLRVTTVPNY